ncbi:MAG: phosphohydrolase [Lachnospiraceae bacterium]|nr:phosphohydrolase [Lachnospiraceae bacterium]MDE7434297.1 phosphohydrolase [Lachnospiraceae bacterium]
MRFVRTDDLKPGMRLAKPIYNKRGVMLYERDSELTDQGIDSVRNFELIGIYILEPAEPVPPLSDEDIAFEQFQTVAMFQLRDCMNMIRDGKQPDKLNALVSSIISRYGQMDHKLNFTQNLRSTADYVYKHSISTAILAAMLCHTMHMAPIFMERCVTAGLLYDFGSLLVPENIIAKTTPLTEEEKKTVRNCRKVGFDYLNPTDQSVKFAPEVLKDISQVIYLIGAGTPEASKRINRTTGAKILQVADQFDRMTAMSLTSEPLSEVLAAQHLRERPEQYDTKVVMALSRCIHILPKGACVDLTNGEKALILEDNPYDYSKPLVLQFSDNQILDLRNPKIFKEIQIADIMKTMDNRIAIDENTLKHFIADEYIKQVADAFRKKQARIAQNKKTNGAKPRKLG